MEREVVFLDGCRILDGNTFGDEDGLLSDEVIELTSDLICALPRLCGITELHQPVLKVEATDCAGNVGSDLLQFKGSVRLLPGLCGN